MSLTPSPLASTPPQTDPSPATVKEVTTPPSHRRTTWALVVSALTGLPALLDQLTIVPGLNLPPQVRSWLIVVSVVAGWLSVQFARSGGATDAARSTEINRAEMTEQVTALVRGLNR